MLRKVLCFPPSANVTPVLNLVDKEYKLEIFVSLKQEIGKVKNAIIAV